MILCVAGGWRCRRRLNATEKRDRNMDEAVKTVPFEPSDRVIAVKYDRSLHAHRGDRRVRVRAMNVAELQACRDLSDRAAKVMNKGSQA